MTLAPREPHAHPDTLITPRVHTDAASSAWTRSGRVRRSVLSCAACVRLLAGASAFMAPAAHAQAVYRPEGAPWSITVPAGWRVAPPSELMSLNQSALAKTKDVTAFVPQYVLKLDRESPHHRYVLVQQQPGLPPGASFDQLANDMAARMQGIADQAASQLDLTPPRLEVSNDPERRRIIITSRSTLPSGAHVGYLGVVTFGVQQQISIHAYADADDFDAALPELRAIADSFRFDPGAGYTFADPTPTGSSAPAESSAGPPTPPNQALRFVLIGSGFLLSILLVLWIVRARRARPIPPSAP